MRVLFERRGRRTVITGWRAWALAVPAMLLVAFIVVAVALFALGVALTLGTILLIGVPVAVLLTFIVHLLLPAPRPR